MAGIPLSNSLTGINCGKLLDMPTLAAVSALVVDCVDIGASVIPDCNSAFTS